MGLTGVTKARRAGASLREACTLLSVGVVYWLCIFRQVRRELKGWDERARSIPDARLREQALAKLSGERLNPEAAALFAVLAPPRQRRRVVSLIVAYQLLYDYLDGINELPELDGLEDGLRMHASLTDALMPDREMTDPYGGHDFDDGGYVSDLCTACRRLARELPHLALAGETIARATGRCGEAQSHNHAALRGGRARLMAWSRAQGSAQHGYLWWEMAAGGISCLNIHALIASVAHPCSDDEYASRVDAAYFPSVCAISALLDSLADYHHDADTGNHSFIAHYRDPDQAASRLLAIVTEARGLGGSLHRRGHHAVILAGIVAYYVSSPTVSYGFPALAARRLRGAIGPIGACMHLAMCARRRHHDRALRERRPRLFSRALAVRGWARRATQ